MAAKANLTKSADIQVASREIDFVTRFARNWEHLREILGIMRPTREESGAVLKSKAATLEIQEDTSKYSVEEMDALLDKVAAMGE